MAAHGLRRSQGERLTTTGGLPFIYAVAPRRSGRGQPWSVTCTGSGVNVTSTAAWPTLPRRLLGRNSLIDRLVDAEDLRQPGDLEDLQYPLLCADEVHRAVVGPHSLHCANQNS